MKILKLCTVTCQMSQYLVSQLGHRNVQILKVRVYTTLHVPNKMFHCTNGINMSAY